MSGTGQANVLPAQRTRRASQSFLTLYWQKVLPYCTDTGLPGEFHEPIFPTQFALFIFPGTCLAQQHQQPVIPFQSTGHSCNKIACCTTQQLLIRTFSQNKHRIYFIKQNWTREFHCTVLPGQKCSMSLINKKKKWKRTEATKN